MRITLLLIALLSFVAVNSQTCDDYYTWPATIWTDEIECVSHYLNGECSFLLENGADPWDGSVCMFIWHNEDRCKCQDLCNSCVQCFGPTKHDENSYCCKSADNGYLNVCIANCMGMSPDIGTICSYTFFASTSQ